MSTPDLGTDDLRDYAEEDYNRKLCPGCASSPCDGACNSPVADTPAGYPETPTLDKMRDAKERSQPVGEFIDWLSTGGMCIAERDDYGDHYPVNRSIEGLLAQWLDIDLNAAERERVAVLAWVRAQNG